MSKHVIILGCGRSGTSIFGELFDHLPHYDYYSEPPFAQLTDLDFRRPVAIKVPRESEAYPADPGLSFPMEALRRLIPEPMHIFWQIRHPLDTIASLKVGIAKNWGHHPRPPDWEQWLSAPLVARCAHHWNYLNEVGYRQIEDQADLSRFEDMLDAPLIFAEKVCRILDIDISAHWEHLQGWARRVQNTNNSEFVEAMTSRPYSTQDHSVRIGRWRENLSVEDVRIIWPIIQSTAEYFAYSDWIAPI